MPPQDGPEALRQLGVYPPLTRQGVDCLARRRRRPLQNREQRRRAGGSKSSQHPRVRPQAQQQAELQPVPQRHGQAGIVFPACQPQQELAAGADLEAVASAVTTRIVVSAASPRRSARGRLRRSRCGRSASVKGRAPQCRSPAPPDEAHAARHHPPSSPPRRGDTSSPDRRGRQTFILRTAVMEASLRNIVHPGWSELLFQQSSHARLPACPVQ